MRHLAGTGRKSKSVGPYDTIAVKGFINGLLALYCVDFIRKHLKHDLAEPMAAL
jgi:hypothetical protein